MKLTMCFSCALAAFVHFAATAGDVCTEVPASFLQTKVALEGSNEVPSEKQRPVCQASNSYRTPPPAHASAAGKAEENELYTCIYGGKSKESRGRTCLFHNICYDTQIQPHMGCSSLDAFTQQCSANLNVFSKSAARAEEFLLALHANAGGYTQDIKITVLQQDMPLDVAFVADNLTVLFQPIDASNFGHTLGDNAWALWNMQTRFQISFNARIAYWHTMGQVSTKLLTKVLAAVTNMQQNIGDQVIESRSWQKHLLDTSRNNRTDARYLCFPNLLVGTGFFSHVRVDNSNVWWAFRSYMLNVGKLATQGVQLEQRIGISIKKLEGRWGEGTFPNGVFHNQASEGTFPHLPYERYLKRIQRLHDRLNPSKDLLGYEIQELHFEAMTMKEQMATVGSLSVLVISPGGGSFVSLFLPRGATLLMIVDPDIGDTAYQSFSNQQVAIQSWFAFEFHLWGRLHWINFCIAPANAEEEHLADLVHQAVSCDNPHSKRSTSERAYGFCVDYDYYIGKRIHEIRPLPWTEDWEDSI